METSDPDNNGIADALSSLSAGQSLPDHDSDNDGIADRLELDSDADGTPDITEVGLEDSDGNGLVDNFTDADGDGFDDTARSVLGDIGALPDANGDGVPDYREVGAGPKLKTGLTGFGAGSVDWLLLGLPLAMLIWRRQRRLLMPILVSLLVLPLNIQAENSPDAREFDSRWYLGANLGISRLEPETELPWHSLGDNSGSGYSVFLGRDLSKHFTLEGYFSDLGDAGINLLNGTTGTVGYEHLGLSALGYFYNSRSTDDYETGYDDEGFYRREGLSSYARIGVGKMKNETAIDYERVKNIHLHYGVGFEYGWSNGFAGRAELIGYDKDAKTISLGLLKRFGKVATYQTPQPVSEPEPVRRVKPTPPPPKLLVAPTSPPFELPIVYFKHNKWELTEKSLRELNNLANNLIKHPEWRIAVRGHTDADGKPEFNQSLSKRRAMFIARHLQSKGVRGQRMMGKAFGEKLPIADNSTEEGRQLNRRVDFEIIK